MGIIDKLLAEYQSALVEVTKGKATQEEQANIYKLVDDIIFYTDRIMFFSEIK